ncbi:MAG TPA: SDR family NAD(P)-dependent oxidoreductase [Novosphingobium sp.]|nr:SDR family NAD(P)-dependent oxidoreductase [Novosphingobium sp.]HPB23111.1 SDR family NAD(P)-dependent oxidoreductase [Novosphingobium sp.]HPZ46814.1 SDR family NAD(P)-dependent oxidoreductase [Novosphingobium sp.]HQD99101.1 SDR family NAD(P)-dependent oxidoreductase [Novosphingobium sp.]HQQ09355.1 SDR family NAD(P)-dependent oxidoreductase [Novosphingobium sp.]
MTDHVSGKSIVITGAGGGFGRLVALKAAARGAMVTLGDIDLAAAEAAAQEVRAAGGQAQAVAVDVRQLAEVKALVARAVDAFGRIDVMINNAGIMPLAFIADHEAAHAAWERCIDINIKGTLNGMVAAHDPMIEQGRGHVINLSSIYGNFPVIGAAVYGASKTAVNFLSESFRVETRGKIKVTIVKPTGVPATGLSASVINPAASVGILGQNTPDFMAMVEGMQAGTFPAERLDPANIDYASLAPEHIADAVIHAIDQPWGVSIGDITVRAAGDHFIL